jgi:hypothetical protein
MLLKSRGSPQIERKKKGDERMNRSADTIGLSVIAVELAQILAEMGTKKG